jgi:hypothetical protein
MHARGSVSAVIAVILLVVLAIAGGVYLFFYAAGIVKQPEPVKPAPLSANAVSNDYITLKVSVVNHGTAALPVGTRIYIAENNASLVLEEPLDPGRQAILTFEGGYDGSYKLFPAGTYTIYAPQLGQALVSTVPERLDVPNVTARVSTAPDSTSEDLHPDIIKAANGRLYVTWDSNRTFGNYRIVIANSSDGSSWGTATFISTDSNDNRRPSLIQSSGGSYWVMWDQGTGGGQVNIFERNSTDSTNWDAAIQLSSTSVIDTAPHLMQASSGSYYFVRRSTVGGRPDIWIRNSSDSITWGTRTNVTSDHYDDGFPSLVRSAGGVFWLAFYSNRSGSAGIWIANSTDSTRWSALAQVPAYNAPNRPSLIQDDDGVYWIAYDSVDGSGDSYIWIVRSEDGLNWGPTNRISTSAGEYNPSLYQASDGVYWLAFEGTTGSGDKDVYTRSTTDARLWTVP